MRPRQPRDVVRGRSTGLAPVAGPDHLRCIGRWRGVGLAIVVALGMAGLGDAPDLAASVDPERDNLSVKWRIAGVPDHFGIAAFVAHEGPARPVDIARRDVSAVAGRRQIGDPTILKPALDDVPLVRIGLADAHIDIAAVLIDRHVAMARPVMLSPVLDPHPVHGEDIRDLRSIIQPAKAVYVPSRGRDTAVSVGTRKTAEIDVRILLP